MEEYILNCSKCGAETEEGFILDRTYGAKMPSDWIEGEPVKSIWTGTKTTDKLRYRVRTFRCVRCGYLESYATDESPGDSIFS